MVNGDDPMNFSPAGYNLNRSEAFKKYNDYLNTLEGTHTDSELINAREEILKLYYYELLILQSSIKIWEKLMNDPDLNFRRQLCAKIYNLKYSHFVEALDLSDGAISNIFRKSTLPEEPRSSLLSVMMNHPWQLINRKEPNPYSYSNDSEYFEKGVSKQVELSELSDEISEAKSICGYIITDAQTLFQHESALVVGRWVSSYPEFDYFEFYLNYEPLIDKVLRVAVLKLFPKAKYLITTYRPFKPLGKRAMWVIFPKDESLPTYYGILHELREYRDNTEFHNLK
jgi:hypothetical protein